MRDTNRISPRAGWVNESALPKGPGGRNLCRWCEQEVPKGRRTFCSDACVHEHKIRTQPGYARVQVEKRDQGVCALCGTDTNAARKQLASCLASIRRRCDREETRRRQAGEEQYAAYHAVSRVRYRMGAQAKAALNVDYRHRWEMDHVKPVVEGGGSCGLDNLRTLCIPCHRRVTKELAGRRAAAKRASKPQQEMDV